MQNKPNILIAEDHDFFTDGIKNHLETMPETGKIFTAKNGRQSLEIIENNKIDILITDIQMPEINGIELCRKLKKEDSKIKIIVLTQFYDRKHVLPLLKIKIPSILGKVDAKTELNDAIAAVLDNKNYYSPIIQETIHSIIMGKKKIKQADGVIQPLTRREKQLLPYVARGLSNQEIVNVLANLPDKIILSPYTIDGHRRNLYMKFNVHNAAKLAKEARDFGFLD